MPIGPEERARIAALLDFWFGAPGSPDDGTWRPIWYEVDPAFDAALRERFGADRERAAAGGCDHWLAEPDAALALVLLLDQLPRNLFRGTPAAYATDEAARRAARHAVERGADRAVPPVRRIFFYLPLMHSEDLADQHRCCALIEATPPDTPGRGEELESACRHRDIVARFGRFPHRNGALGRPSTPEEIAFLQEPDSSF